MPIKKLTTPFILIACLLALLGAGLPALAQDNTYPNYDPSSADSSSDSSGGSGTDSSTSGSSDSGDSSSNSNDKKKKKKLPKNKKEKLQLQGQQMQLPSGGMQMPSAGATSPSAMLSMPDFLQQLDKKWHFQESLRDRSKYEPQQWNFRKKEGAQSSQVDLQPGKQYMNKKSKDQEPVRGGAEGWIKPSGQYQWDGRVGQIPNPTLTMPGFTAPNKVPDSGYLGGTDMMLDSLGPDHMRRTTSITNAEFGLMMAANSQMANELRANPDGWRQAMRAGQQAKQTMQANQNATMAETNQDTGFENTLRPLINIANEDAWSPCSSDQAYKSYANAAWMVGQMYKQVYIPMAILLLLPGAIMTQVKVVIRTGFLADAKGHDDDLVSPFSGILRSIIAVFLIPATQLFVSYTIDVGNSLTYEVINFKPYFDLNIVKDWRNEQTFDTKQDHNHNYIPNTPPEQRQGKYKNDQEKETWTENQSFTTSTAQQWFNTLNELLGQGVNALNAFQLVMIMYLFLLGPIAAALFAWPGSFGDMFRKIYGNWMNGVVLVVLWKFWWAIILLCMSVRLQAMQEAGSMPPPNDTFEMFMCASFVAMLMYIPFNPFDFKPGDLVDSVLEKAQQQTAKAGSGAATTGGTSSAGNSGGGSGGGAGPGGGPGSAGKK